MQKHVWLIAAGLVAGALGCGSSNNGFVPPPPPTSSAGDAGADATGPLGGNHSLTFLTIDPPKATVESLNGAKVTQAFTVTGHYSDGSSSAMSGSNGVAWSVDNLGVGALDGTGLYTANGQLGGVVNITATASGQKATAALTVKLHLVANPGNVSAAGQSALQGANTPDPSVVWNYPYNDTVWPRGLAAPTLMWNGGNASDSYYVHITSLTFELEDYATAPPPAQLAMDANAWQAFVDSTSGSAVFQVTRYDGTTATVLANHVWTIAPASMHGTIYYWANNLGRVMRIKPGATTAEDFSAGIVPSPGNGCTMACHTVSADGSTLIATGGTFGGTYDLKQNKPGYGLGGAPDSPQIRAWALSALTPDGAYMVADGLSPQLTGQPIQGMFKTADGSAVATAASGLGSELYYMPAFSPDGSSFVFVGDSNPKTKYWAATATAGALKALDFNESGSPMLTNERDIVQAGSDTTKSVIAYPTVSPDGRWALYARMGWIDPSVNYNLTSFAPSTSDLYIADLKNPGTEIRLANLDGDGYPFAAGARDLNLNFEPTLAPVAAGGYFWVVFLSRRTYGNILTGDRTTEKQLWVAAIDQNPQPGKDPSHAAFHLPGQDVTTLNLRGYWALDPCKQDGQGCQSGTECCGGYCDNPGDGGAAVCQSAQSSCSKDGDHCGQTSDCCNASSGSTCINHVCSEPTPK
jgi:hypothetical protein